MHPHAARAQRRSTIQLPPLHREAPLVRLRIAEVRIQAAAAILYSEAVGGKAQYSGNTMTEEVFAPAVFAFENYVCEIRSRIAAVVERERPQGFVIDNLKPARSTVFVSLNGR